MRIILFFEVRLFWNFEISAQKSEHFEVRILKFEDFEVRIQKSE
jgi:hypothetical protein